MNEISKEQLESWKSAFKKYLETHSSTQIFWLATAALLMDHQIRVETLRETNNRILTAMINNPSHCHACNCEESKKPLKNRDWTLRTRKGRNRLTLTIVCNHCDSIWDNKNPKSKYWKVIGINPLNFFFYPLKVNLKSLTDETNKPQS